MIFTEKHLSGKPLKRAPDDDLEEDIFDVTHVPR
jgi:hypothetical protein